jgi:hypothetical protein
LAGDAGRLAKSGEFPGKILVVSLNADEQAAGIINTLRGQALEDLAFLAAFNSRLKIVRDVSGARMQQAMVAARSPGAQILFVDEQTVDATQGQIPQDACAGDAAADYQDLGFESPPTSRLPGC